MLAQIGSGAQEFDGARAALQKVIERFGGSPASGRDEFRRGLPLGAAVRNHGENHRIYSGGITIRRAGRGLHHAVRDQFEEEVFGERDVFERQGHGPFVRRSFEIPLGGRQILSVRHDGVAGLFQIFDAFVAIGL